MIRRSPEQPFGTRESRQRLREGERISPEMEGDRETQQANNLTWLANALETVSGTWRCSYKMKDGFITREEMLKSRPHFLLFPFASPTGRDDQYTPEDLENAIAAVSSQLLQVQFEHEVITERYTNNKTFRYSVTRKLSQRSEEE